MRLGGGVDSWNQKSCLQEVVDQRIARERHALAGSVACTIMKKLFDVMRPL